MTVEDKKKSEESMGSKQKKNDRRNSGKSPAREEISHIKSSKFSRGLSVLGMTASIGAKLVGYKVGEIFSDRKNKDGRLKSFLEDQAAALVREFGQLKGSFMKVGQMLSVYGEYYLPDEVNSILKKLQSESVPVSWESMQKLIRKQLGEDRFRELIIDETPVSAASMGQVYRGTVRKTGEAIALKVQYPGVEKAIDNDLKAIKSILGLSKLIPSGPEFDEIFNEVRMMLKYETDYRREFEQIEKFAKFLSDDPRYIVPKVFAEYSSKRILCMSYEDGIAIDSGDILRFSQQRRNMIGTSVLDLMFCEMFEWRQVQTDCHFGNFRIREDEGGGIDRLVLYDFGAIRKFSKRYMAPFSQLVFSAIHENAEGIIKSGLETGFLREEDSDAQKKIFVELCIASLIPFNKNHESPSTDGREAGNNPYLWGETDLISDLSLMAKNTAFAFKFRPPPRESLFLNRKMVGTYFFLREINYQFGPRKILLSQL